MDGANTSVDIVTARKRADLARARFNSALASTKERVKPAQLKANAVDAVSDKVQHARDRARAVVREHPVLTGAVVVGGVGLIFWRPIRRVAVFGLRGAWMVWLNRALWNRTHG